MLLLELGVCLVGIVAIATGQDLETQLQTTVIDYAAEDGFVYDPIAQSPRAIHTEKLKGIAHLSNDHGISFALPDGNEGVFTVSNKHCIKAPKTASLESCLCYNGVVGTSSKNQGLTTCYARDMVPLCIKARWVAAKNIVYDVTYVDAKGDVQNKVSKKEDVKLIFTIDSAHVEIDGTKLEAAKVLVESMHRIFVADVRVNAVTVKSHDCVSFEFDQVIYGGQLISHNAFPRNTFGTDCFGACVCDFKSLIWEAGVPAHGEPEAESAGHSVTRSSALKAAAGAVCAATATSYITA